MPFRPTAVIGPIGRLPSSRKPIGVHGLVSVDSDREQEEHRAGIFENCSGHQAERVSLSLQSCFTSISFDSKF